ncbi:hypothetical protein Rhopal_001718-T1 [Rhodotorula paludigena]|uniref:Uncharacterized protein n=1 Tax=Rhodotorula paludigena TaxID=86838 RepID=A0AAV5GG54_9BASI|nr:hypothetical protein Rhopal_001718-T1 [Rhodotorula paludigena]
MLESLSPSRFNAIVNGGGSARTGSATVFLLLALRTLPSFNPRGVTLAKAGLLTHLNLQLGGKLPPTPLALCEAGNSQLSVDAGVKDTAAALADRIPLNKGLLQHVPKASWSLLRHLQEQLKNLRPQDEDWDVDHLASAGRLLFLALLDLGAIESLDPAFKLKYLRKITLEPPIKRAAPFLPTEDICQLAKYWWNPLRLLLSPMVPAVTDKTPASWLTSERHGGVWHDPAPLLLCLDPKGCAKLAGAPFGPSSRLKYKFDQVPVHEFGKSEADAAACLAFAEYVWEHRAKLLAEPKLANVAALPKERYSAATNGRWPAKALDSLPFEAFCLAHPRSLSSEIENVDEFAGGVVWAYPGHCALAAFIADRFSLPTFSSTLVTFPLIDPDAPTVSMSATATAATAGTGGAGDAATPDRGQHAAARIGPVSGEPPSTGAGGSRKQPRKGGPDALKTRKKGPKGRRTGETDEEDAGQSDDSEALDYNDDAASVSSKDKPEVAVRLSRAGDDNDGSQPPVDIVSLYDVHNLYQRVGIWLALNKLQQRAKKLGEPRFVMPTGENSEHGPILLVAFLTPADACALLRLAPATERDRRSWALPAGGVRLGRAAIVLALLHTPAFDATPSSVHVLSAALQPPHHES